ncbi:arginine--tRNA ligase [Candidatus Saccharibacteria bacterium]|nr:arginine--tRNA ligase [Candidatus Saccharibacteria bacterium]MCA9328627.1 arginine--tRNA ligase [Candidatus Saccharibacteria bacterium]
MPASGRIQNPEAFHAESGMWHGIIVPELPSPEIPVRFIDPNTLPNADEVGMVGIKNVLGELAASYTEQQFPGSKRLPVNRPPDNVASDAQLAIPAHAIAKLHGQEAAKQIAGQLRSKGTQYVREARVDGSFINVELDRNAVGRKVLQDILTLGDTYGANRDGDGKLIVMDVSSPNIAKEMHLGHLRSTVIGEALRRIMMFNGFNVIRDNHVGDWGTQFGLLGRAVELWGDEVKDYLTSPDPSRQVQGLLQLYVKINVQIANEKAVSPDGRSALEDAGRAWFVKLENGDEDAVKFWRWASQLSMKEFNEIYEQLGTQFEYILGESVYESSNQSVIEAFKQAGLTFVDDKGVVKVKPSRKKGDALGIQKPDGTSLYGTRDLATIAARMLWFDPDRIVYVVGGDQNEYFANVFDSMGQYLDAKGVAHKPDLHHVSFGAVELPEGPMSTRKGNVVPLRDVVEILKENVRERVYRNLDRRETQLSTPEVEEIIGKVAIGSLIYYDLKGATKRKIVYDPDEVTSFEGNSGASLQYTVARINSILENAGFNLQDAAQTFEDTTVAMDVMSNDGVARLVDTLGYFSESVRTAATRYEPSVISEYLVQVASQFNGLLEQIRIIDNPDSRIKQQMLLVAAATRQVMMNGLSLLNIPVANRM